MSFGLVTIPINLYAATESRNIAFHQVHAADGGRIHMNRVCSVDGEQVAYGDISKGYETADGRMVILSADDMAELPVVSAKTIEVLEFVPLEAIDPIYFDRSYYLEPQKGVGGVKAYLLLRDALAKSGRVAITKVAIRQRESLAILRIYGDVMVLSTMLWPDEVRAAEFGFLHEEAPQVRRQELDMAGSLISALSEEVFEPDKYHDEYRAAVEALIEAKIAGNEVAVPAAAGSEAEVLDLMAALNASLARATQPVADESKPPPTKSKASGRTTVAKKSPPRKAKPA